MLFKPPASGTEILSESPRCQRWLNNPARCDSPTQAINPEFANVVHLGGLLRLGMPAGVHPEFPAHR